MKSLRRCAIVLIAAFPLEAAAKVSIDKVTSHAGMCEASAAVPVQEQGFHVPFVVANDEDNVLRTYPAGPGGPASEDLNAFLALDHPREDNDKIDLEAAAWVGGKVFWLASHSRSGRRGKLRAQRHQFFSTAMVINGDAVTARPVLRAEGGLFAVLAGLNDADLRDGIMPDQDEAEGLRPEKEGLNIEGMAAGADGASLLIGLRNPLSSTSPEPEAIVLRLDDPLAIVQGGKPDLRVQARLKLGGRGIRSIEHAPGMGDYYIVAGPVADAKDGRGAFALYQWSGQPDAEPAPVEGFAEAVASQGQELKDFHPEAMIVAPDGKRIRLLSDDGDACDNANPSFRAVEIGIE